MPRWQFLASPFGLTRWAFAAKTAASAAFGRLMHKI
jgi:hypothetical protein